MIGFEYAFLDKNEILELLDTDFANEQMKLIVIPKIYEDIWDDERPNQIWHGSRFGAKSWTKALQFLIKATQKKYFRGIFARNTQKSARDSQFRLFTDLLKRYPFLDEQFEVNKTEMLLTNINTGHLIKGGSFEQSSAIMGIPEVTDFWADEPINRDRSITRREYEDIAGTLRNSKGIQPIMHLTFNPIGKQNFVFQDFFDVEEKKYTDDRLATLNVNYIDNPFCPQDRIDYLDGMKTRDYERWLVDAKGEWGEPENKMPFLKSFKASVNLVTGLNIADAQFITNGWDFNNAPTTAIIAEKCDFKGIRFYKEYQEVGGVHEVIPYVEWLNSHYYGYEITGDNNGWSDNPAAQDTCFDIIAKHLKEPEEYTKKANKLHKRSRQLINYAFWRLKEFIQIDKDECPVLASDFCKAEATEDGKLRKDNGEFRMDAYDAMRYIFHIWFETTKDIDRYYDNLMYNRSQLNAKDNNQ